MPPVRHRMPGHISWLLTLVVGVLSPAKGKRRIDIRVLEMERELEERHIKNDALVNENRYLREELYRVQAENNLFQVQDEMNVAVNPRSRTTSWACPDMESTLSMSRPNPTTICPN